jgi:hypothetical protein
MGRLGFGVCRCPSLGAVGQLVEVRCSRVGFFAGEDDVVITGGDVVGKLGRDVALIAMAFAQKNHMPTAQIVFGPDADPSPPLLEKGRALHIEYRGGAGGAAELSAYGGATFVALASLILQRRPRSDTAVLGSLNKEASFILYYPREPLSAAHVRACAAQGVTRLIVAPHTEMDEAAEAALVEAWPKDNGRDRTAPPPRPTRLAEVLRLCFVLEAGTVANVS